MASHVASASAAAEALAGVAELVGRLEREVLALRARLAEAEAAKHTRDSFADEMLPVAAAEAARAAAEARSTTVGVGMGRRTPSSTVSCSVDGDTGLGDGGDRGAQRTASDVTSISRACSPPLPPSAPASPPPSRSRALAAASALTSEPGDAASPQQSRSSSTPARAGPPPRPASRGSVSARSVGGDGDATAPSGLWGFSMPTLPSLTKSLSALPAAPAGGLVDRDRPGLIGAGGPVGGGFSSWVPSVSAWLNSANPGTMSSPLPGAGWGRR